MNYEESWKKIDVLIEEKVLPRSALAEVEKIYDRARKDKNHAQQIKALVYMSRIAVATEEGGDTAAISRMESEIRSARAPQKNILQSITAHLYWQYLQNNRWKYYGRTNTEHSGKKSIDTWTIDDFHKKISTLFLASLEDRNLLQQTRLENFEPLIVKGNSRHLRPTLYDLLADRALYYFGDDERDITKPAYAFTIEENAAFDPVVNFIHHSFQTKDTASLLYRALLIYQDLLSFHREDKSPDALIDADLRRLQFVHRYAVMPEKDEIYRMALEHLISQYGEQAATAGARYLLAQLYYQKGEKYDEINDHEELKNAFRKAKEIAETTVKLFPETEGAQHCVGLLNTLLGKSLALQTEKVNVPGEPFRTLIAYKNLTSCYFRIVPINNKLKEQLGNSYEAAYWEKIAGLKAIRTWQQQLPQTDDLRKHSVEIKIDALPIGEYLLLGSVREDFGREGNLLAAQYFFVSNISYIRNEQSYFVLHRNTGQPLPNASVQVWTSKYDYTDRKNKLRKAEWVTSDEHGWFRLNSGNNDSRNIRLEIKWQGDYLFPDDYQYLYTRYNPDEADRSDADYEQKNAHVFFFTDRSIYRPGQTIYFKGIAITKHAANRKAKIITNQRIKIFLQDVNRQTVDSLTLTLNEFGSVHGQFRLPQNALTGNFSIRTEGYNQSSSHFSVEAYKRPKFNVTIRKPTESYRVNDTVVVRGSAQAYAGNNIDGARVRYRISREAKRFSPWLFFRRGLPSTTLMEIANGITSTDASGAFVLQFIALPDQSLKPSLDPIYDYTITVDVTDINGETRSSTEVIQIGYRAIQLEIGLAQKGPVAIDAFKGFSITSENLSDEFEPVAADIKIYPLTSPERLIRARYWEKPDQFLYTKEEYLRYFPHDEYDDESDHHKWAKGVSIYSDTLTTSPGAAYVLSNAPDKAKSKFQPGWYVIEVTAKDRFGTDVKAVEYVELYNNKSKELSVPAYQWNTGVMQSFEPGSQVSLFTGSSAGQVFLIQQIDRNTERIISPRDNETRSDSEYQFFHINNEKREFTYTITEADRGGFGVIQFFVKNNRFYLHSRQINVPWTNKQLNISYSSFRDKLEPGSSEKWEVKITGKQGEKVAAELLVSMYDASLDQFKPHQWNVPQIWPNYWVVAPWLAQDNFSAVGSNQRDEQKNEAGDSDPTYTRVYDRLIDLDMPYGDRLNDVVVTAYGVRRKAFAKRQAYEMPVPMAMEQNKIKESELTENLSHDTIDDPEHPAPEVAPAMTIRKDFNETAFFFPALKTDSEGNVSFSFTTPEALTRWKLMTLAHTQSLAFGYAQQFTVTQKDLMVQPNAPRFVREKDHLSFSTKIVNLSDGLVNGFARLELFDATTNRPVDDLFYNAVPAKNFSVAAGQSTALTFGLTIPENFTTPLLYRISATSSQRTDGSTLTDGEENIIPVLNNRMLVTESLPLNMRGSGTKSFRFEKLLKQDISAKSTLKNYALTVEYTPQPVWYAVQSLPYLIEYPFECSEQTFNRYYANILASYIANSAPRIKEMYNQWQNDTSNGKTLVSALQKNEELKSILLQETPWVLQAQDETQQKQNIALLFDVMRMGREAGSHLNKLREMQTPNGGFVWFKGGHDNRYITQYILTGLGHLLKLNALSPESAAQWNSILLKALEYADERIQEDYQQLIKQKADLNKDHLTGTAIQYLYMRSFFADRKPKSGSIEAYRYYRQQAKQYWSKQSTYMKGMIALSLYRSNEQHVATAIMASLKETAMIHEDLGMYWKDIRAGFYWHEAPVETQALLVEAFQEITRDTKSVEEMKLWLLKQKQTQHWGSTKSTAEACYALLLQGRNGLNDQRPVTIQLGAREYSNTESSEAGSGYFKFRLEGEDISPAMGNIRVTVAPSSQGQDAASWGAVYWQYFEDLDKVTASSDGKAPLRLDKQLWIEQNSESGPVLLPIDNNTTLKVGDKLKVRIELRADRDMEYVHMKDLRAAGTEPVNVLSGYRWQGGLGYYESTRDASTNFFFSWLKKGTYVFEYPLFVTHQGDFSSGVTTIQCMYAPEFTSHSEGKRIRVSE